MGKFISRLLVIIGIVATVASLAYCITRFLLVTDDISGTDADTRDWIRHEPVKRSYTKLVLPKE